MSFTVIGSILGGVNYWNAVGEVENHLEEGNSEELDKIYKEATKLVSDYNNSVEIAEKYLENPYKTSFALTVARQPIDSWKRLGYCKALSDHEYRP